MLTDNDDVTFLTEFLKEANVMLKLQHPNIIKMYGVILAPTRLVRCSFYWSPLNLKVLIES